MADEQLEASLVPLQTDGGRRTLSPTVQLGTPAAPPPSKRVVDGVMVDTRMSRSAFALTANDEIKGDVTEL